MFVTTNVYVTTPPVIAGSGASVMVTVKSGNGTGVADGATVGGRAVGASVGVLLACCSAAAFAALGAHVTVGPTSSASAMSVHLTAVEAGLSRSRKGRTLQSSAATRRSPRV